MAVAATRQAQLTPATASAAERVLPIGLTPATIQRTRKPWSGAPPMVLVGASMTALVVVVALFAPFIARVPYDDQDLSRALLPPFWVPGANLAYPLGTDFLGRDLLSRLAFGARTSLVVGISAVLVSGAIGLTLGLSPGYFGRWADTIIMRLVDLQLAFPPIVLAIGILTMVEPSLVSIAAVLGVVGWVQYARVMRAQTLSLREREFVVAARVVGARDARILLAHILPNALGPILVIATVNVSTMILAEASLSFLGIGVRPPTPAWGTMLSESRDVFHLAWWNAVLPGLAIVWTVFGINLLGDAWQNRR
jgi:peptide/nickel transport system permease protein